jgi:(1->4)-alpha-D-glucan 1-alpha-D-glucosylmutase
MGVGHADNSWWLDVLEWGPKSPFAGVFDIDWTMLPFRSHAGLLLPILGKPYGEALEQGEIKLRFNAEQGSFSFWYFDHRLPVRPDRYSEIVKTAVAFADAAHTASGRELLGVADHYGELSTPTREQAPTLKAALACVDSGADIIEAGLAGYTTQNDDTTRSLHRLLERQHYRLAHWRVAISEINYRRFFDINDLAGIRVEDIRTFRLTHRKVAQMIADGTLHGLRLDHIDGLYHPEQYCSRLQRLVGAARGTVNAKPFYTVVEKILAPNETIPKFPGIAGTTGYDVLNLISRALIDNRGLSVLEECWQTQAAPSRNFAQIVDEAKSRVIETTMASEFTVLCRLLARIAAGHWPSRDYTRDRLRAALELFILEFPVYRTYIAGSSITDSDRSLITRAIAKARERWYGSDIAIFDFLQDVLTLDLIAPSRVGYSASRVKRFVAKLQQFTGPVTAKAVEDTAFYRYHRLLALNEVGNDPSLPALTIADFHKAMATRAQQTPHAMTTTATHDTKRGEDARARIATLSEIAGDWSDFVRRSSDFNARFVSQAKPRSPSRAHEYMFYQALIGAWPNEGITAEFIERITAYVIKAAREGKQETSWLSPNEDYESAFKQFVMDVLDREKSPAFLDELETVVQRTGVLGALNGLSQLVLKATVPGVPDFYQGTELWDFSLVDPDNRRAVDFEVRAQMLEKAECHFVPSTEWRSGRIKLALVKRLLKTRTEYPILFADGRYEPIDISGVHRDHVIGFARVLGKEAIIVGVSRHFAPFTEGGRHWPKRDAIEAAFELRQFRVDYDLLHQAPLAHSDLLPVAAVFGEMPVAILHGRKL